MSEVLAPPVRVLTWDEVQHAARAVVANTSLHHPLGHPRVYGVPRGGLIPAALVADHRDADVIVDDLIDSGATLDRYRTPGEVTVPRWALFGKPRLGPTASAATKVGVELAGDWLIFPWEVAEGETAPTDAVVRLLQYIGEDPTRDGLADTPTRVLKSLREMTSGMLEDPAELLATTFDVACDEMVVTSGIRFSSLCEHHLLPFTGRAVVGYVPGERVVGLSKMARLVDLYARRPQVQERMTEQIAEAMEKYLAPEGVGVVLTAHHACMSCRGVRQQDAAMTTSALRGLFKDDASARSEFLSLARQELGGAAGR
jgi:GTP cyclohydrolase I